MRFLQLSRLKMRATALGPLAFACLALSLSAAPGFAQDSFAFGWLERCLIAAEAEKRPSAAANDCMQDAMRVCEFAQERRPCLVGLAEASDGAANVIMTALPQTLAPDATGAAFYEKRHSKVSDPLPLLVCNAPQNAPAEHCSAMTAMWRLSSARALKRMVDVLSDARGN